MPKQCPVCDQIYPDFVDYCVSDGHRLERARADVTEEVIAPGRVSSDTAETDPSSDDHDDIVPDRARLFPKVNGQIQPIGVEFHGDVVLGRFDPDMGTVDIDLTDMPGSEYVSPRHAALIHTADGWFVEDLGSGGGVFVGRGARIEGRVAISSGQELALGNALFVFETDEGHLGPFDESHAKNDASTDERPPNASAGSNDANPESKNGGERQ